MPWKATSHEADAYLKGRTAGRATSAARKRMSAGASATVYGPNKDTFQATRGAIITPFIGWVETKRETRFRSAAFFRVSAGSASMPEPWCFHSQRNPSNTATLSSTSTSSRWYNSLQANTAGPTAADAVAHWLPFADTASPKIGGAERSVRSSVRPTARGVAIVSLASTFAPVR